MGATVCTLGRRTPRPASGATWAPLRVGPRPRSTSARCNISSGGDDMGSVDLYDNVYGDFASDAEFAVRREAYGEDLGQSSWLTATEWIEFADQLGIATGSNVLEIGSGSGGPAVY